MQSMQLSSKNNVIIIIFADVSIPILKYLSSKKSKEKAINPTLQFTPNSRQPFVKVAAFSAFYVLLLETKLNI